MASDLAEMNRDFYNDYQRYKKESFAVNTIATQLIANVDISKPVVFIGAPQNSYFNNRDRASESVNGLSMISWGVNAFGEGKVHDIFKAYGYDFLILPSNEQKEKAKEAAADMKAWPTADGIKEFDDFIVVKLA